MSVHRKLGIILENKVVQKLNLEKNVIIKKWSPKLIFLNSALIIMHQKQDMIDKSLTSSKLDTV